MRFSLFMLAGLLACCGCFSRHVLKNKAQSHMDFDPQSQQMKQVEGEPKYYALLPVTVIGDVATAPFQIVYFLFTDDSHSGSVSVRGVPIPIP